MDAQIDMLSRLLVTVLGVFILVVCMVLIYIFWLWLELHREVRRAIGDWRVPEVPRDANGRWLKERL
jgi:hypothetical protein